MGNLSITFKVIKSGQSDWKCAEVHFQKSSPHFLNVKRPNLAGGIIRMALTSRSDQAVSWWGLEANPEEQHMARKRHVYLYELPTGGCWWATLLSPGTSVHFISGVKERRWQMVTRPFIIKIKRIPRRDFWRGLRWGRDCYHNWENGREPLW